MKKLLLAFTLLIGFTAFSQGLTLGKEPSKEIKLEKGRFYIDGTQIPSYQMKKVFASNTFSFVGTSKASKRLKTVNGKIISLYFPLTNTSLNTSSAILQIKLTI